jgi:hypothetical protein
MVQVDILKRRDRPLRNIIISQTSIAIRSVGGGGGVGGVGDCNAWRVRRMIFIKGWTVNLLIGMPGGELGAFWRNVTVRLEGRPYSSFASIICPGIAAPKAPSARRRDASHWCKDPEYDAMWYQVRWMLFTLAEWLRVYGLLMISDFSDNISIDLWRKFLLSMISRGRNHCNMSIWVCFWLNLGAPPWTSPTYWCYQRSVVT